MGLIHHTIKYDGEPKPMAFEFGGEAVSFTLSREGFSIEGVGDYDGRRLLTINNAKHCCGLSGFGHIDDVCEGCDESSRRTKMLYAIRDYLEQQGILERYLL
jgi:hypothetical protein